MNLVVSNFLTHYSNPLSCRVALAANNKHSEFSTINFCRNLAVRVLICDQIGKKLKLKRQFLTTSAEPVRKIFIKILLIVNSSDCLSRVNSGHIIVWVNI